MELFRSHCNLLWSQFKVATLNRLRVGHNDILKGLLGLPRWCSSSLAFARNGVNNLVVIRRHSTLSLRSRVELSENSIITSIRQSSAYVCGPIQQQWLGLLKFYKKYGSPGIINLCDTSPRPSLCQLFVVEYERLQEDGSLTEDRLMEEAALALEARGIYLDYSRAPPKPETSTLEAEEGASSPTSQTKISKISLADVFKQSQEEEK
ncbi:hypothetical protein GWK47_017228 [Chionoecetes opilio]|uniref:Small ribosomal subunit protein mS23 conserved domain-containing protein n=1 Tax=Chionoecetes opilio TaxID=41210 RepID=A0A8J5CJ81_CHIOP|nr:hypothetical protein GWK47_017228 [Chionoecetes opilio]